jgi:hypothetical protein
MPKLHARTDVEQACGRRGPSGCPADAERVGSPPDCRRTGQLIGGCDKQQALGLARQLGDPAPEAFLDPTGQRHCRRQTKSDRELGVRQPLRQFEQRKRVAAGLGDDPIAHALVQVTVDGRDEQGPSVLIRKAFHDEFGKSGQILALLPRCEHDDDRVC